MRYIVFDTETTDVGPDRRAIEFALMEIDSDLRTLGECSARVHPGPGCVIAPEAEKVHGISLDSLAGCPTIEQWVQDNLGGPLEGEVTLIGHRVGFDKPMFKPFGNVTRELDTLPLAFEYVREAPNKKLETLAQYLGLPGAGGVAHSAAEDVAVCHQLLMHLCDVTGRGLEDLITVPYTIHFMPWGKHEGKPLHLVPRQYRNWLLNEATDLDPNLRRSLEQVALMDPPMKPVVLGAKPAVFIPRRSF